MPVSAPLMNLVNNPGPLALAFRDSVVLAGGSLSAAELKAVGYLYPVLYAPDNTGARLIDVLDWLWLPLGGFSGMFTPLVNVPGSAMANHNFVSGDLSGGLTGNGSSKGIDTGQVLTRSTGFLSVGVLTSAGGGGTQTPIGVADTGATQLFKIDNNATNTRGNWGGATNAQIVEAALSTGRWTVRRNSTTSVRLFKNGASQVNSATSTTATVQPGSVYLFARNLSPTFGNYFNGKLFYGAIGQGTITDAQVAQFDTAMSTVQGLLGW